MGNELAVKLDSEVLSVIGAKKLGGFQDAYVIASAVEKLKVMLTDDYMKPIMQLQGNRLGYKTDKDKDGGYPMPVVRNSLIEAVLIGVQPTGNQFNIIAGGAYITKEGFGYLLNKTDGLSYTIVPGVPNIDLTLKRATVLMKIKWTLGGEAKEQELEIVTKADTWTTSDAVIGKATRKSRCWLFNTINDAEIPDADADEIKAERMEIKETQFDWNEITALYNTKKGLLTATQQKSSEKIITSKDKDSYDKLKKFLVEVKAGE